MTTATAVTWLEADPDPVTRDELQSLMRHDPAAAEQRFASRLRFGTAGLRGELGAGPSRMNRVIVRVAALALGRVLLARDEVGRGVAVGHDARHRSDVFADDTARVLAALGIPVFPIAGPRPTPLLAFATRHFACGAGVMVTASHNPPADNGYKVYWGDGAQIVPPVDTLIEAEMAAIVDAGLPTDADLAPFGELAVPVDVDALVEEYLHATIGVVAVRAGAPRIVYTPLHGVGWPLLRRAFAHAGIEPPLVVEAQRDPDPDFPTVSFPNPEEPGAMDLALELATAKDAGLVLANDPDADRLAVAVPAPDGAWRVLRGDEVGVLLADHLLGRTDADPDADHRLVVCSLVSSQLLAKLAAAHGVAHRETLTGFKWIMRAASELPDHRFVFGYEEALGYAVTDAVRDKDGVSAAVTFVDMVAELAAGHASVLDRLEELALTHGRHLTGQVSLRYDDPAALTAAMSAVRADLPSRLGAVPVVAADDLLDDGGRGGAGAVHLGSRPPYGADIVRLWLEDGSRVIIRPSGTEPKIKCYLEVVGDPGEPADATAARLITLDAVVRGHLAPT